MIHYLFGFSGRINRAKQWAFLLVALAWEIVVAILFALTVGFAAVGSAIEKQTPLLQFLQTPQVRLFGLILCVSYLVMIYMLLAITTKRLHDRNKSAMWLLVFLLLPLLLNIPRLMEAIEMFRHLDQVMKAAQAGQPAPFEGSPLATLTGGAAALINLWAFIELYCLRGTVGDNAYGPDPLAGRS